MGLSLNLFQVKKEIQEDSELPWFMQTYSGGIIMDPNSCSNAEEIVTEHLHLRLLVDFAEKKLRGTAKLKLKKLKPANVLKLDAFHLDIKSVHSSSGNTISVNDVLN